MVQGTPKFLQDCVLLFPDINNTSLPNENLQYPLDGAPLPNAADIKIYLDQGFPNKGISKPGSTEYPQYLYIYILDFFLWGYLKDVVHKTRPDNIEELKTMIRNECNNISQESVSKVQREFIGRLGYCQAQGEFSFQHLINEFVQLTV